MRRYVRDLSKSIEEQYAELEAHHILETTELAHRLEVARAENAELRDQLRRMRRPR